MELYRPRGASIPRNYRQLPAQERFTVTDAAQLKRKLQALDGKLAPDVDVKVLRDACEARPFHEEIYVDGSEELFLLVKGIWRADLIPAVFIEAYATLQQGRFPPNQYRTSDFTKGADPTFSDVRRLLGRIDELCGTKLFAAIRCLEDQAAPFPFLRLPAELRLDTYSYLLNYKNHRRNYISLISDRSPYGPGGRLPRMPLDVLRVNRQLHDEVTKALYEHRTLFLLITRDKDSRTLSDEYMSRYYETLAQMAPRTRAMFTKVELKIGSFSQHDFMARRYKLAPPNTDHMRGILAFLPNARTFVITLPDVPAGKLPGVASRFRKEVSDTLEWMLPYIPADAEILWDLHLVDWYPHPRMEEQARTLELIESRGPVKMGRTVTAGDWVEKRVYPVRLVE